MPRFLQVTFNFESRAAPIEKLKTVFDKALDWVFYAPNCWILYTTSDEEKWFERIRKVVHDNDSIFIVEVVIEKRSGWLPQNVWEWIQKDRTPKGA